MRNTRKLASILSVALLAAALAGCSQKSADTTRVVLDWTPNTNHTGLYVALEKGYYADEGLNVEILQPPADGALTLLAAGNCEFAVDIQEGMGPALAREGSLPVVAVAALINHNTSGIMSLAETGIESPKDLEGKRFATWETPLVDAVMKNIIEGDGGSFDEMIMIPNAATDAFSALQTDVDAIWIYYAWDGVAAEVNGFDVNFLDLGQLNPTFDFYTPVLATNTEYAAENPEQVKKFMRATEKGYQYAIENPEEAAQILLKYAPELDENLVLASQIWLADKYIADAPRWGEIDPERWGAFYGWMYEQGLLEKDIRTEGFTNEYLPG